jgi:energy-converting hydrogenase Eha subunit A
MIYLKALLSAAAVALVVTAPSFAHHKPKHKGGPKVSKSVPGPVAALGLPAGVAIGGYVWLRRRARKGQDKV